MRGGDEWTLFVPAGTPAEAIERIFALTGRSPDGSRGEKRALIALRDALNLDVENVRTGASLGASLAAELGTDWDPAWHTARNTVTLDGLNVLLEGAMEARRAGSLRRLKDDVPTELDAREWSAFEPARSKIEAVTRIAALTGAPKEWLGPGGKEHKSVLLNFADRALADAELDRSSKTRLAASIARELGVPWTDKCESTGETISLTGLNIVLAGAERRLGKLGTQISDALLTPEDEGDAVAAALLARLERHWEGHSAVTWLADRGLRGANDNEWQGFYGEERAKLVLAAAFSPPAEPRAVRFANTTFDYALNFVWDIKVHTDVQIYADRRRSAGNVTILNDERATRECVAEQGLGFIIINGAAMMDESGEFVRWHRQFKARTTGKPAAPSNSGVSRMRKASFSPLSVESFWVPNSQALDAAILGGALRVRPIGRQAPKAAGESGDARPDKFEMRMTHARSSLRVARYDWATTP